MHVKNYAEGETADEPLRPVRVDPGGALDWAAILGKAVESGYAGPVAVEFPGEGDGSVDGKLAAAVGFLRAAREQAADGGDRVDS